MPSERSAGLPVDTDALLRTALVVIPLGVLGNIVFLLLTTDRELLAALDEFPLEYLLLAMALGLVPWLTNTLRLLIWTHFLGLRLRFGEALQIVLAVILGSAITPTATGGGAFKWGMLVRRGMSPGESASVTTLAALEDGLFFAIALPTALYLTASWQLSVFGRVGDELRGHALPLLAVVGAVALVAWVAVRIVLAGGLGRRARWGGLRFFARARRRLRAGWRDARDVFALIAQRGKARFAASMSLTAVQWAARYSVISALVAFLGADVDPLLFWVFQWIVFTLMAFIPTPGATGGAEAAFYLLYSAVLPAAIIGIATAAWRFFTFYFQVGLGAVVFFVLHITPAQSISRPRP